MRVDRPGRARIAVIVAVLLSLSLAAAASPAASIDDPESQARAAAGGEGPSGRIVGGRTTTGDAHPFQAALVLSDAKFPGDDFERQFCGGSLITPVIVLTAAHCVVDADPDCGPLQLTGDPANDFCTGLNDPGGDGTSTLDANDVDVIVGRTTLSGTGGSETPARGIHSARNYTGDATKRNDLGFVSLSVPSTQARIDIVDRNDGQAWTVGAATRVSGYGATFEGDPLGSDTLRVATVPVIADSTCGSAGVYDGLFDPVSMICAGVLAGGTDSCQGDSGGPLQTAAGPPFTRLVGIVSFGAGCAEPNKPGVHTRIAQNPLCSQVVDSVAWIESLEAVPASAREPVVGPAGCADGQFAALKKCKRKASKGKRKKGKRSAAAAKCKMTKKKRKKKG